MSPDLASDMASNVLLYSRAFPVASRVRGSH